MYSPAIFEFFMRSAGSIGKVLFIISMPPVKIVDVVFVSTLSETMNHTNYTRKTSHVIQQV